MKSFLKQTLFYFNAYPLRMFFLTISFYGLSLIVYQQNALYSKKKLKLASEVFKNLAAFKRAQTKIQKLNSKKDAETFIQKMIESKSLLEQILLREKNPNAFINFDISSNKFSHQLKQTQKIGAYQTQHFILKKPVFVDEENLKELIATVEGSPIFPYTNQKDTPYCYFDFFSMKKTWLSNGNQVYQIFYELVTCQK